MLIRNSTYSFSKISFAHAFFNIFIQLLSDESDKAVLPSLLRRYTQQIQNQSNLLR